MNLTIIRENCADERTDLMGIITELKVERHILAKRRWNAKAENSRELIPEAAETLPLAQRYFLF